MPSPKVRQYIYGILVTLAPLAVIYGLVSEQEVALWLAVGAAILGNGLALANTPSTPKHRAEE